MSEFQYVEFRAIDRPVSKKNLAFMRRQSTRADITPWSFVNEYNFGEFRGDAPEMLRRGYDIHLHYANFGIRTLMIRLPRGFPDAAAEEYVDSEGLRVDIHRNGPGITLILDPYYEPGTLEDIWELEMMLDRLVPLRAEILCGDLRPLYLAHLAVRCDDNHDPDEATEGPVPAGLRDLSDAQQALAEFYEIGDDMLAASSAESDPLPDDHDVTAGYDDWISQQSDETKVTWLAELMKGSENEVRAEMTARYLADQPQRTWPVTRPARTVAQLQLAAEEIRAKRSEKAAAKAARVRRKKLAKMAENPRSVLAECRQLVTDRTTIAYGKVAEMLAGLREAVGDRDGAELAEEFARTLKEENPTLRHLTAALRRKQLLPK